ncbi:MAG: phosphoribosylamine--glycine ligase [Spirochaetales bacterium]|uniref:Phosphoribosylamine--glycine ligase n=1 Tax=Candidatus Thalassospirochaeta sargassi TaxID=3119039 RepID=A0AAJ1MHG3_9SPIO|nr:phosphoribosylamine--glycine ligase [Spirochaetales bacterium]
MKVLILGSGAREHAVTWKYSKSKRITGLYIAPGNAGTGELGVNLPDVDPENSEQVIEACRKYDISHVFVGPEAPLAAGIVDELKKAGIPAIGPHKSAARLEGSKVFSKNFMKSHNIPTADAVEFKDTVKFETYIRGLTGPVVIKKDGLAAGKGVLVSSDPEELIAFGKDILKDDTLLVESCLEGYEVSIFALTDGKNYKLLPVCADFKRAGDGDTGLNTGGMGAICPVPFVNTAILNEIEEKAIKPTFKGMEKDKLSYSGILYFGFMMTDEGPMLLEYNVRFGDPEAQVLIPLIDSDFGNIADAMLNSNLDEYNPRVSNNSALGVVVAAEGYPGSYEKGIPVSPIPVYPEKDALIFHSSTSEDEYGKVHTGGGRCFTCVGIGPNSLKANARAYEAVKGVKFKGAWHRNDIGKKFFTNDQ